MSTQEPTSPRSRCPALARDTLHRRPDLGGDEGLTGTLRVSAAARPARANLDMGLDAMAGRTAEGVSRLEQAAIEYDSARIRLYHSLSVVRLGEAYVLAAQPEATRACADLAMTLVRERGERGCEACTLRLLGDIITSHGPHQDVTTAAAL